MRTSLKLPTDSGSCASAFPYIRASKSEEEGEGDADADGGSTGRASDPKDDSAKFEILMTSLQACGICGDDLSGLMQVVSGLLHLGAMRFAETADGDGSELRGPLETAARDAAAEMLGVGSAELVKVVTTRTLSSGRK